MSKTRSLLLSLLVFVVLTPSAHAGLFSKWKKRSQPSPLGTFDGYTPPTCANGSCLPPPASQQAEATSGHAGYGQGVDASVPRPQAPPAQSSPQTPPAGDLTADAVLKTEPTGRWLVAECAAGVLTPSAQNPGYFYFHATSLLRINGQPDPVAFSFDGGQTFHHGSSVVAKDQSSMERSPYFLSPGNLITVSGLSEGGYACTETFQFVADSTGGHLALLKDTPSVRQYARAHAMTLPSPPPPTTQQRVEPKPQAVRPQRRPPGQRPPPSTVPPTTTTQNTETDPYGFQALVNNYRARFGLRPLRYDANLSGWARKNNLAQRAADSVSHFVMGPAHRQNATRRSTAYAAMFGSSIDKGWVHSPPHNAALLDPNLKSFGIAALTSTPHPGRPASDAYWTFNGSY